MFSSSLLGEMFASLDAIRSGEFHAEEVYYRAGEAESLIRKYFVVFDRERDLLRFDFTGSEAATKFVRGETAALYWYGVPVEDPLAGRVERQSRDFQPRILDGRPFDWRMLGCESKAGWRMRYRTLDDYYRDSVPLLDASLQEVAREGDGIVKLRWFYRMPESDVRVHSIKWFDRGKGARVVRAEGYLVSDATSEPVRQWCIRTEWVQHSGEFVPAQCLMEDCEDGKSVRVTLDWHSVNVAPRDEQFELAGMGLLAGTPIYDRTVTPGFQEGFVGIDEKIPQLRIPDRSGSRFWWVLANVVLLAVCAFVWWRRMTQRAT
jgi:hypothetical protein